MFVNYYLVKRGATYPVIDVPCFSELFNQRREQWVYPASKNHVLPSHVMDAKDYPLSRQAGNWHRKAWMKDPANEDEDGVELIPTGVIYTPAITNVLTFTCDGKVTTNQRDTRYVPSPDLLPSEEYRATRYMLEELGLRELLPGHTASRILRIGAHFRLHRVTPSQLLTGLTMLRTIPEDPRLIRGWLSLVDEGMPIRSAFIWAHWFYFDNGLFSSIEPYNRNFHHLVLPNYGRRKGLLVNWNKAMSNAWATPPSPAYTYARVADFYDAQVHKTYLNMSAIFDPDDDHTSPSQWLKFGGKRGTWRPSEVYGAVRDFAQTYQLELL